MSEVKKTMTDELIKNLERRGMHPHTEVTTDAGVADLVTEAAVYEVVPSLTSGSLLIALDRVISFRDALNTGLRAIVYGRPADDDHTELSKTVLAAQYRGVTVNLVPEGKKPGMT